MNNDATLAANQHGHFGQGVYALALSILIDKIYFRLLGELKTIDKVTHKKLQNKGNLCSFPWVSRQQNHKKMSVRHDVALQNDNNNGGSNVHR